MDKTGTYYCVIERDFAGIPACVYRINLLRGQRLVRGYGELSNKIWCQGPKGGVKIIKDRTEFGRYGYVTNDEAEMKEFMWAKLQAREVN